MTEDEMVGWHHRLNGHEFEQAPGDGEGQGRLACCSPRARKESDMPERLNNNNKSLTIFIFRWSLQTPLPSHSKHTREQKKMPPSWKPVISSSQLS